MAELTKLGRYQLKQVLGRGAMGVVYEGLDPSLNRRVAVKTILKNSAIDAETARHYSAQFAREAQAAGRLNHPHIVQVHDFAEEGDVAYLVMEYIQGRELRSFFEAKEKFEVADAVRIMGELLDALEFAHEAGVIHRDVKPANVMLDAQRRVKLADFGVARIQDSERSAAGTMVGTPAFMSPEQIQGLKIDRRTDIFSAGTILYQLLTGDQPFTGAGAWTVAKKIMEDKPPQPSSVVKSISPAFDAIVDKALAKKPADRYASAREFAAALRATIAPAQMSVPPATPAIPAAKSRAAPQTSDAELEFWRAIQNSTDAAEFEFYLEQFPEGTYAGLARHKIAKLKGVSEAEDTVRLQAEAAAKRKAEEEKAKQEAEARAKREADEQARREAVEQAKRDAEEKAQREAEQKAKLEAEEKARREAQEKARQEAAAKAKREADERVRRETEEKVRQAQALARLKQHEEAAAKARASAAVDDEATVALPPRRSAPAPVAAVPAPEAKAKSMAIPVAIAAVVAIGAVAAYFLAGRSSAPAPVAETAPAKPAAAPAPVVDADTIRRETEERLRKEFAEKAAAERATMEKTISEKLAAERAAAEKVAQAKTAAERASAEKAAAAAVAARVAVEKAAAEKAAAEKAATERAGAERAAADKAAAERVAAEKMVAEKAAADRLAAEKAAAEKVAVEKAAAGAAPENLLDRFIQRVGRDKVLKQEPATGVAGNLAHGQVVYVNDGSCGPGRIKEVTGAPTDMGSRIRPASNPTRCISLADDRAAPARSSTEKSPSAAPTAPATAAPAAVADTDPRLERFMQRQGRERFFRRASEIGPLAFQEVVYLLDGSCPSGQIKEVRGGNTLRNTPRSYRCIPITD